jgi:predicted molibdopterin-dependent oxidoreductase YjgC
LRFRPLEPAERDAVEFEFDGRRIRAPQGISVAAALWLTGNAVCRITHAGKAPRGPHCMMGVCFECIVEVEGRGARQSCMLEVAPDLRLKSAGRT